LLDEDDVDTTAHGGLGGMGWGDVMMPVNVQPLPHVNASAGGKEMEGDGAAQTLDEEEEWGW